MEELFREKVLSQSFPCIGAKAAIRKRTYQFCVVDEIAENQSTKILYQQLEKFTLMRSAIDDKYASFIVCFQQSCIDNPYDFHRLLWQQLKMLNQIDSFDWDPTVASNIEDPNFSYSIAGEAYFVIGLCPNHPRKSRQFSYPTIIFNSHHQFLHLKKIGLYSKIQRIVRRNELLHNGSINPNLTDFGERSEAYQYSGIPIENICHE